jgi:chorismate mutase-like protein
MLTDATETRLQQHLRPTLCAIHPDQPFDFSEKAYLLPNDFRWKAWVDQWLHQSQETGELPAIQAHWLGWKWLQKPPPNDVDRLAAIVAERLKLAYDVAEYKWNTGQAIEDKPREQAILDGLVEKAAHAGVPAERAKDFFRAQIEASKVVQRQLFAEWTRQKAGHFADAPDLASETRPRLDALTDKLIEALARSQHAAVGSVTHASVDAAGQRYLSEADWGEAASIARASLATH